jgi:hypothetical protein
MGCLLPPLEMGGIGFYADAQADASRDKRRAAPPCDGWRVLERA